MHQLVYMEVSLHINNFVPSGLVTRFLCDTSIIQSSCIFLRFKFLDLDNDPGVVRESRRWLQQLYGISGAYRLYDEIPGLSVCIEEKLAR